MLNNENNTNFGESSYRKRWKSFKAGIRYEQNRINKGVSTKVLSLSDIHVPFHLPISIFKDYINSVDILQINGDVGDCQGISRFPKTYRVSPMEELIETRQYLIELIEYIKPKKVIVNYGNHDIRFQSYFAKHLDTDLLELMPSTSLELILVDGFKHYSKRLRTKIWYEPLCDVFRNIEITYTDNWFCQIGSVVFCHPFTFKSGIMKTAESAMTYFKNEGYVFNGLVMAHTHRLGQYKIGNTTLYDQGCCCDTSKISYSDGNLISSQKQGFLYLGLDSHGDIVVDKQISLN
jgi:predicted phosphodiesterase